MTPDQLREHVTAYIRAASPSWSDVRSFVADEGHLIRTATITVTWNDEPTPTLPAWLIEATDQLVDEVGHPAPGSLTALVASAYRAGQQVHPAQPDVYLHGDSGYLWLTCNRCDDPLMEAQAGDNLADFNAKAAAHQATCAATQPVQEAT